MYTSFFGFKENPFNLTPDPRFLFLSRYHKEALDHMLYGIKERKGFIAITGGIGTGKTTLCRHFLTHLDPDTKSALIFNSFISDKELLVTINQEFNIAMAPGAESKKDYIDALNGFLLDNFSKGGNAVLLIDEAQNLSYSVLEQLRMLSNLETEKEKLIQIILVGQPELKELLAAPSLRQLDERITVRYDLKALDPKDIKGYVDHRLVVAGSRGELTFSNVAIKTIFAYSRGNPRRINAVCDRALLIAYAAEKYTISARMVSKAVEEVGGHLRKEPRRRHFFAYRFRWAALFIGLLLVIAAFAGRKYQENIAGMFLQEKKVLPVKTRHIPHKPMIPEKKGASLFLDEQDSLSGLFKLVNDNRPAGLYNAEDMFLDLVAFDIDRQYAMMIKRPFRIRIPSTRTGSLLHARYLLVRELSDEWGIVVNADGKEQTVSADFILGSWGTKISWFFPYKKRNINLGIGMRSADVHEVQRILIETGHPVDLSGVFDEKMLREIIRFQKEFGLVADGIVGPMTRAVLYLIG